ncbi:SDR family NAD(P)-dependent oxidoreductase [Bartonella tamiae]|uniref:3-oxoacyl-[acyl-carrier-protein] reductase n=1 Tax=Bartonella tamiae Th239 TaxID=1094558 RepID=J0ZKP2_9HYPH|nr:SDR family NAD(P)-dependent oxidoreductase [Bartonella tamiae]EJF88903.1 hypothetical protein ME5_01454 [Bartonella tamiae Th239]EJF94847.1 hypothetical protein MEG_00428 [Bartonella tamiae Th307]
MSDAKSCADAVANVAKEFGRIDGLVNNAGANDNVGLEDNVSASALSLVVTCLVITSILVPILTGIWAKKVVLLMMSSNDC